MLDKCKLGFRTERIKEAAREVLQETWILRSFSVWNTGMPGNAL